MLNRHFLETLPKRPYCTDDYSKGIYRRMRDDAVKASHIEFNASRYVRWLVFDIDRATAFFDWQDKVAPTPNFIIKNPKNGHCHYVIGLRSPVAKSETASIKALRYLAAVEGGLLEVYEGDYGYSKKIAKNPLSDKWDVWTPREELYDLDELAEYIPLSYGRPRSKPREIRSYGRNVALFDSLRFWAYEMVKAARSGSYQKWSGAVLERAREINLTFNTPLSDNEVSHTAKSVTKWTWTNYSGIADGKNHGVMQLGLNRANADIERLPEDEVKRRQSLGGQYSTQKRIENNTKRVLAVIANLKATGQRVTKVAVARISGISRAALCTTYKDLFKVSNSVLSDSNEVSVVGSDEVNNSLLVGEIVTRRRLYGISTVRELREADSVFKQTRLMWSMPERRVRLPEETPSAVRARSSKKSAFAISKVGARAKNMRPWTTKEVKYLQGYYGFVPCEEVAAVLSRSPDSVRKKASRLGIKSKLPHKLAQDVELIKTMIYEGATQTDIARRLGITTKAVRVRLNNKHFDSFDRRVAANNYRRKGVI